MCHACYIPRERVIMSLDQKVLFIVTTESINEMLQVQPGPNLTPPSIWDLLDQYTKLSPSRLAQIFQTFIVEKHHILTNAPPYVSTIFSKRGKQIVTMISCILGYTTNEYIYELILAFMSIFAPRNPPATLYNYVQFIAERMHEQFTIMHNERVFKYSYVLYHMFLYYQSDRFTFTIQKLDTKGKPRSVIFWTPLYHMYSSPYTSTNFIDSFVHLVMTILIGSPPPRIRQEIKSALVVQEK